MYDTPLELKDLPYKQQRTWTYTDNDAPVGQACYDCGMWYGEAGWVDVIIPNEVWKLINPSENEGCGLLCFNCINRRLEFLGLKNVPHHIGSGALAMDDTFDINITG